MKTRTEIIPIDLLKPRVDRTITIVASTKSNIELRVQANGTSFDCTGLNLFFHVTTDESEPLGISFSASAVRRGSVDFVIPSNSLTAFGAYGWQVLCVIDDESTCEWARGTLRVLNNPSAKYTEIIPDTPSSEVLKDEINKIKARMFDVAVNGIRQYPAGGVVNVLANYDHIHVVPSAGIAEVEANKINTIEEWSVGFIDTWIPEIEKPIYGEIYWDEDNQVWNTADLYTDDGFSGAVGIGSLHDDWDFNTPTPKDGFYGYTDLHADYSIEQVKATTPIRYIDDGDGYTVPGFYADIVFRSNTTGELRTITNFTFVAWDGMADPTNTSLSLSEPRYEEDGSEWYVSEVWGDVSQLMVDDPTVVIEPIDITYMFADSYPWVSLRLGFRREQSQELQEILLKTPNAQGVADYIVDITIPDGALDIYIRSENYYGFVSSNAKALALEAGRNLLTFTELNGDFLVNRAMLKEVGV